MIKSLVDEFLSEQTTADLVTKGISDEQINKAWPNHVLFKGSPIFDPYIKATDPAFEKIKDEWDAADGQECYLGYVPEKELFVMGFDCWWYGDEEDDESEDESGWATVTMKFDGSKFINIKTEDMNSSTRSSNSRSSSTFYHGGYNATKRAHPTIIDLRLD
jgi:hypothetical protein